MTRYRLFAATCLLLFGGGLAAGVALDRWWSSPRVTVGPTTPDHVTPVMVNAPNLKPSVVAPYVTDTSEVTRLLNEQAAAKREIDRLTETIATLHATGSGPVVYVDRPVPGPPGTATVDHEVHFGDGRLTFDSSSLTGTAHYGLTQKVEVLAALGKTADGTPTAAVKVFELWPGETRTPFSDVRTTFITADATAARWRLTLAVQGGVGAGVAQDRSTAVGGVFAAQWLTRGSSKAAGDTSFAVLTPAVLIGRGMFEPAVLPVSWNVGRRLRPLSNLWLSPLVTPKRIGLSLTATF